MNGVLQVAICILPNLNSELPWKINLADDCLRTFSYDLNFEYGLYKKRPHDCVLVSFQLLVYNLRRSVWSLDLQKMAVEKLEVLS